MGWVGVDLDGVLASYEHWIGEEHVGEPIIPMIRLVQHLLTNGYDVRIFTARVAGKTPPELEKITRAIDAWCIKHIGRALPITCIKDYNMIVLYDDRCVQMIPNTGRRADGEALI